jgi:hypothetical protein
VTGDSGALRKEIICIPTARAARASGEHILYFLRHRNAWFSSTLFGLKFSKIHCRICDPVPILFSDLHLKVGNKRVSVFAHQCPRAGTLFHRFKRAVLARRFARAWRFLMFMLLSRLVPPAARDHTAPEYSSPASCPCRSQFTSLNQLIEGAQYAFCVSEADVFATGHSQVATTIANIVTRAASPSS